MIYLLAVLLVLLAGWSVTGMTGGTRNPIERLGLSALLGMGLLTGLMFVLGRVGLSIAPNIYLTALGLFAIDGLRRIVWRREAGTRFRDLIRPRHPVFVIPVIATLLLILAIIVLRSVYLPNVLYDSLTAFDLLGKIIAREEVFRVSLFGYTQIARGGSYPPFPALTFAWGYACGLPTANAAMALPVLAFASWLWGFARRFMGATSAFSLLLLAFLSPDFYTWTHLPVANFAVTIYAAPALLYVFAGLRERSFREICIAILSAVLLVWSRAEGAVFVAGGTLVLMVYGWRAGFGLRWLPYLILPAAVFLLWQHYATTTLGGAGAGRFTGHLFWDPERASYLVSQAMFFLSHARAMGFSFTFLVLALLSHLVARRMGTGPILLGALGSLALYCLIYYQIDPAKQDPLPALMQSSFRRGITAFTVPFWFAGLLSPLGGWLRRVLGRLFATRSG